MSYINEFSSSVRNAAHRVGEGWHSLWDKAAHSLTHFSLHPEKQNQSKSLQWGVLSCEMIDDNEALQLKMEVPGIEEKDLHVEIRDQLLIVTGERKFEHKTSNKNYLLQERAYGSFTRQFMLPERVDADQIQASYRHGVLSLYFPKIKSDNNVRKIPISSH